MSIAAIILATSALATDGMTSVQVPFHYLSPSAPLIMVPAKLNGRGPYEFIVDTGNGGFPIIVSPELAGNLGLKSTGDAKEGFTVDLNQSFHLSKADRLELGDLSVGPIDVAISPAISDLTSRLKVQVDGNLGYPFLKDYAMSIDFKHQVLTLSKEFKSKAKGIPITVQPSMPLILVDVVANGKKLKFVLDTGASACCLSHQAAKDLNLAVGVATTLNRAEKTNSYKSKFKTLKVGSRSQSDVTVAVADFVEVLSKQIGQHIDGVLGKNFWSQYKMTIDYPGSRLLLEDPK